MKMIRMKYVRNKINILFLKEKEKNRYKEIQRSIKISIVSSTNLKIVSTIKLFLSSTQSYFHVRYQTRHES